MIKGLAFVGAKYSGKEKIITAGTIAIAAAAGKEIKPPAIGNKVRYIAGEEHTVRGIAHILSAATVEWLQAGLKNVMPVNVSVLSWKEGPALTAALAGRVWTIWGKY